MRTLTEDKRRHRRISRNLAWLIAAMMLICTGCASDVLFGDSYRSPTETPHTLAEVDGRESRKPFRFTLWWDFRDEPRPRRSTPFEEQELTQLLESLHLFTDVAASEKVAGVDHLEFIFKPELQGFGDLVEKKVTPTTGYDVPFYATATFTSGNEEIVTVKKTVTYLQSSNPPEGARKVGLNQGESPLIEQPKGQLLLAVIIELQKQGYLR